MNLARSTHPARPYRGRFAPSPTGPLHFGSLVAALGCALEAHAHDGEWLIRIEDLDTPRNVAGAADSIVRSLERLGFEWHGEILRQSERLALYQDGLDQLAAQGATFWCGCSRREIGKGGYRGTCRAGIAPGKQPRTQRFFVGNGEETFDDRVQGPQRQRLADAGDFVVLRADGVFAYQLAVCVDDLEQGVTDIVRGADLLSSTGQQRALWRVLDDVRHEQPGYAHLPVAMHPTGSKLSKQTAAPPIDALAPADAICAAFEFLGQAPPAELRQLPIAELWRWMKGNWAIDKVPKADQVAPAAVR